MPSNQIINDTPPLTQFIATGGQTVFNTNWTANVASDIVVYARADGAAPDDATQLVSTMDYDVDFIGGAANVRVTFLVGRTANDIVTITRATPADRLNLYTNTNFVPSMLNQDTAILTMVDQQNKLYNEQLTPRYNTSASVEIPRDVILPQLGPQQIWQMNADQTAIEAITYDNDTSPAPSDAEYWISKAEGALPNAKNLGLLASGLLKHTVVNNESTPATAIPATDYWAPGNVITLPGLPSNPGDAASKQYVDAVAAGYNFLNPVGYAATANLTALYNNGSSGVGATLTNSGALAAFSTDGQSPSINSRILVQFQSAPEQNGIYVLTTVGSGAVAWVLTRATDFDTPSEISPGDLVTVQNGTLYGGSSWQQTAIVTNVGVSNITFILFGIPAANVVTLNTNQTITGQKTFNATTAVTGTLNVTGQLNADNLRLDNNTLSATDTNGIVILEGNGTGYVQINSANASGPLQLRSGTGLQHITNILIPNTSATRNTTFQDADGTIAYLENLGYRFILTQSAGNVASSVFNNLTGYSNYYFILTYVLPVTNGAQLLMQYSTDNGSTWRSTSGDYVQQAISATNTTLATTITATATGASLNINQSNAVAPFYGNALLIGANLALIKSVQMRGFNYSSAAVPISYQSECYFTLAAVVNAVRFIYTSGNINLGQFTMYGML